MNIYTHTPKLKEPPVELPLMAGEHVWKGSILVEYGGFWRCYSARDVGVTKFERIAVCRHDARGGDHDGDVKVEAYRYEGVAQAPKSDA